MKGPTGLKTRASLGAQKGGGRGAGISLPPSRPRGGAARGGGKLLTQKEKELVAKVGC